MLCYKLTRSHPRVLQANARKPPRTPSPTHTPTPKDENTILTPGDKKPLSTAMKCVMSLLFLYFLVVIMMKAIIFTKQIKLLYAKAKADMPDIPGMESKDDGLPVISNETKAKLAAAAAQKIVSDKIASVPGGAALNATTAYTKDLFMNMFSEEKLAKVMTNMAMVPMFCILITFCRLRARVDLETEPQVFAKTWMMVSTACLFVQVLSCMLPDIPETPGNTSCCSLAKGWLYFLEVVNLGGMLGLYAGIGVICYSIFGLRYKEDQVKGATLPAAAADASEAASASASGSGSE